MEKPHAARCLVVDNDVDTADTLALLLNGQGHAAVATYSGPAALEAIHAGDFELVLLDVDMPVLSGIEVARAIREAPRLAGMCIAFHTGMEAPALRQSFADFDHHFRKPAEPAFFLSEIRRLLDSRRGTGRAHGPNGPVTVLH